MARVPIGVRAWPLPLAGALLALLAVACGGEAEGGEEAATSTVEASPSATATEAPGTATEAPEGFPVAIFDSGGELIELSAPPQRIISYSPGATEILFAIGAGDRVVAADEFSDYPEAAAALPKLTYSSPDPEQALALDPDLVLMSRGQSEQVEQFRNLGMTVFFLEEAEDLEGVLDTVDVLGLATGERAAAAVLVAEMRERIDAAAEAIADVETGPRVFFELTSDLYTVGPNTFVGDLLQRAKAENVAAGSDSPFPQLSSEAVVEADPEVVLLPDGDLSGDNLGTVCARPGWDVISACTSERVFVIDGDVTSRPGPRIVEGLELIVRLLYPDRLE